VTLPVIPAIEQYSTYPYPFIKYSKAANRFCIDSIDRIAEIQIDESESMKNLFRLILLILLFLGSLGATETLKVAIGYDIPPFIFGKIGSKGIDPDLIRAILEPYGYRIEMEQMSKYYLENILEERNDFNGSTSIRNQKDHDGIYYSDAYLFYDNVVITPRSKHITIRNLDDLAKVNFVAWSMAWRDLGGKFFRYFNPRNGLYKERYHENPSQKDDVEQFFDGKYDALVIDRNIFAWYRTLMNKRGEYDIHPIFPSRHGYSTAWRSKKLRDQFNAGLARIKADGTYEKIVRYNRTHNFQPLIRMTHLIAQISSLYLYRLQPEKLKKVLEDINSKL